MERRSLKRIELPGTVVRLKRINGFGVFSLMSKPSIVMDISKSGLSFKVNEKIESGQPVQIRLTFSDGRNFDLKGVIRWFHKNGAANEYRIGVQFLPFGSSKKYNPIKALNYLRNLEGQNVEKFIRDDFDA